MFDGAKITELTSSHAGATKVYNLGAHLFRRLLSYLIALVRGEIFGTTKIV
jgi:hypothetical protein